MIVEYLVQPDVQLGRAMFQLLDSKPSPLRVVFVSAFVGLQSIMRIRQQIVDLAANRADIRFVLGIDLGGTSREVVEEMLAWNVDVRIVKNRLPGHTFHPKLFLFEWRHQGMIIIGSNNITEGGFFANYEGAARITYALPDELAHYESACRALSRFLDPQAPISHRLTPDLLASLLARSDLPTEDEARQGRDIARRARMPRRNRQRREPIFGVEAIDPPPPLPAAVLERLVAAVRDRRARVRKEKTAAARERAPQPPLDEKASSALIASAFYMTLPTLQGTSIPGEARIPLEAIELAKEFWGWPEEYLRAESPRAGQARVYWNWRPIWRVWSVERPTEVSVQPVRMYMYENSSDFRFYVRPLVNAGGNLGDVVRIVRVSGDDAEYECVLARQGTPEYEDWIRYCTQPVRNSTRTFGYA